MILHRLFALAFVALWAVAAWKVADGHIRELVMIWVLAHGYAIAWCAFSRGFQRERKRGNRDSD